MSVARSLVAYERGAVGPSKDCAYEGPYIKAITGYPISLEGAEAAVAHASPVGNIAKATADLWSNESVQNIKLLGGMAPICYLEQLIYDCRLMNEALADGPDAALLYRLAAMNVSAATEALINWNDEEAQVAIARLVRSRDSCLRANLAVRLGAWRNPACRRMLWSMARDTDELVRSGAASSLGEVGHPNDLPVLRRLARDGAQDRHACRSSYVRLF